MNSFYGGPSGQSFEIQEVFKNKVAMYADLQKRWQSNLGVGSFVFIAYGLPGQGEYDVNKKEDIDTYSQTYNSTLWQKIYIENTVKDKTALSGIETIFASEDYGLGYRLIASCTGNTPQFEVLANILSANEKPYVTIDNTNVDNPKLTFHLPHSYDFVKGNIQVVSLDVDQLPSVSLNPISEDDPYTLKFGFNIPKSQVINQAIVEKDYLNANQNPTVRLDIGPTELYPNDEGTINNPILRFALPKVVSFDVFNPSDGSNVLDPGTNPYVSLNSSDPNNLVWTFYIPTSQKMQNPGIETLAPLENPKVEDIGTIREPKLKFSLPRAVKFYYGDLLGKKTAGEYILSDSEVLTYAKGDYYINAKTGFVYLVTNVTETQTTFQYITCIQAPLPQVNTTGISPFKDGEIAIPSVNSIYDDIIEQTGWKLNFNLPLIPKFEVGEFNFVGSDERDSSNIDLVIKDNNTMKFLFTLAQGSKIWSGIGDPILTIDDGVLLGDVYIDVTEGNDGTGNFYKFESTGWVKKGSLKGPVGPSLNIVDNLTNESWTTISEAIADISAGEYSNLSADSILAVTVNTVSGQVAYWVYRTINGNWASSQLTGAVSSFIANDYASSDTRAYSLDYINSLIEGTEEETGKLQTYSKAKIDKLLSALDDTLNTWGTFADLPQ